MGDSLPPEEYVTGGRFYNNYMKDKSFYGPDAGERSMDAGRSSAEG